MIFIIININFPKEFKFLKGHIVHIDSELILKINNELFFKNLKIEINLIKNSFVCDYKNIMSVFKDEIDEHINNFIYNNSKYIYLKKKYSEYFEFEFNNSEHFIVKKDKNILNIKTLFKLNEIEYELNSKIKNKKVIQMKIKESKVEFFDILDIKSEIYYNKLLEDKKIRFQILFN